MFRYIVRRFYHSMVVLLVLSFLTFGLLQLGGDPASLMSPDHFTEEDVQRLRESLGLDRPFHVQYLSYMRNVLQGDFGTSFVQQRPALPVVINRLPQTLLLASLALIITAVVAIPLGVLGAVRRGSIWDRLSLMFALGGQAIPNFWFGIMLILLFSIALGWLPSFGSGSWRHVIMPAVTLALGNTAIVTRIVRSTMVEVLDQDYVRTARAKGLGEPTVLYGHALRNTALPTVTVIGLEFGALLSGAIITETVFAYPGIGFLAIQSIRAGDFPVVLAVVMVIAILTLLVNLVVDILYAFLDPRIVYE
jgi:peptide/nickel transport system permease protein